MDAVTSNGPNLYANLARRMRVALGEFDDTNRDLEGLVKELAEFKRTHLARPARAVNVGAILEVVEWLQKGAMGYRADRNAAADKLARAIGNAQAEGWKVPKGWALVLITPTQEMIDKGTDQHECEQGDSYYRNQELSDADAKAIYAAMLNASPTPPQPEE